MSSFPIGRWRQACADRLSGPFARLVRHSVQRIFSGSDSADAGELDLGIGAVLALLAMPGAMAALFVSGHYGSLFRFIRGQAILLDPYTSSTGDEYFFVALAMAVAGLVAVWKWDRLLPDRRDFINLAPLPVSNRSTFFANLIAILTLTAVIAIDVNGASCVLFPVFVTFQWSFGIFLKFFSTHALAVLLASAFGFILVFAVMAVMMTVFPFRVFRTLSFYVRCGFVVGWTALLTSSDSVPYTFSSSAHKALSWTHVPPPAWFLGLCQSIRGSGDSSLMPLGGAAVWALCGVSVLALAGYSLSFRRCYLRTAEMSDVRPPRGSPFSFAFRWFDRWLSRSSLERGGYRFALRTFFRSQEHAFLLGAFAVVGMILAEQTAPPAFAKVATLDAAPSVTILEVPLILGYFLVLGLYAAFAIPSSLRSNWVFRFHVDPAARRCPALARRIAVSALLPLVILPCFVAYFYFWGWRIAALHSVLVLTWCMLLLENLLVGFRKIPFTCSVPAFMSNAILYAFLFVLGFFVFTSATATVESWAFGDPLWFVVLLFVALTVGLVLYHRHRGLIEYKPRVIFEDKAPPTVEAMNLG